jgi:hypothetical protein
MRNGTTRKPPRKGHTDTHTHIAEWIRAERRSYDASQQIYRSQIIVIVKWKTDYGARVNYQMTAP